MVVVSHLFLFLWKSFRGRCDSYESHLPPVWNYLFPDSPLVINQVSFHTPHALKHLKFEIRKEVLS